jgi:hypothetical protein
VGDDPNEDLQRKALSDPFLRGKISVAYNRRKAGHLPDPEGIVERLEGGEKMIPTPNGWITVTNRELANQTWWKTDIGELVKFSENSEIEERLTAPILRTPDQAPPSKEELKKILPQDTDLIEIETEDESEKERKLENINDTWLLKRKTKPDETRLKASVTGMWAQQRENILKQRRVRIERKLARAKEREQRAMKEVAKYRACVTSASRDTENAQEKLPSSGLTVEDMKHITPPGADIEEIPTESNSENGWDEAQFCDSWLFKHHDRDPKYVKKISYRIFGERKS